MLNRNYSWQEIVAAAAFCGMLLTGIKAFWFNEWRLASVETDIAALVSIVDRNKDQLNLMQQDIRVIKHILEQRYGQQSTGGRDHNH